MAFDAGFMSFVIREINERLTDGKVEKIYQPGRDEAVFLFRARGEGVRLLINAGSSCPRICLTGTKSENPPAAPMFCMLLRKHLSGAKFRGARQLGFERAVSLSFDCYDEMGFKAEKNLIYELMGTYSNIILTDAGGKILGLLRQIDFSASSKRQLLPGMIYSSPPPQDKINPIECTEDDFSMALRNSEPAREAQKFIMNNFSGISPLVAREIAYRAGGAADASVEACGAKLSGEFFNVISLIKNGGGEPHAVYENGVLRDFCFMPVGQYGQSSVKYDSFGALVDFFYEKKSRDERIRQRAADVFRIVNNARQRAQRKTEARQAELAGCSAAEEFRLMGDLIKANIYRLKRGMEEAELQDYSSGELVRVKLDSRLSPAANAQQYYKKYSKLKSAREHLAGLIKSAEEEGAYIATVADALSRAETEKELAEIRSELFHSGYAAKMKGYSEKKQTVPSYLTYVTSGGYTVLCGKNNLANDYITFKKADKNDWWFHVKNQPGSHTVMLCAGMPEPSAADFTEAAVIAATHSKAEEGPAAEVDYTLVRHIKKPSGAKPGFVIYHTNWSATVVPDKSLVERLQKDAEKK